MSADLECVDQEYNSYTISYFNYYMNDFNKISPKCDEQSNSCINGPWKYNYVSVFKSNSLDIF